MCPDRDATPVIRIAWDAGEVMDERSTSLWRERVMKRPWLDATEIWLGEIRTLGSGSNVSLQTIQQQRQVDSIVGLCR